MARRNGLTRLEILVIIVLGLVVLGFVLMTIGRVREAGTREQCKNNLRIIGLAFQAYHDESSADKQLKTLPPARIADGYATWAVLLGPHLSKDHPVLAWDLQTPYFTQKDEVREAPLIMFICPARRRDSFLSQAGDVDKAGTHFPGAIGDYACVAGDGDKASNWTGRTANGPLVIAEVVERKGERILKWESQTSLATLTRGSSYTLLVGEKHALPDHLGDAEFGDGSLYNGARPANFSRVAGLGFPLAPDIEAPFNNNFGSWHKGVCQFLNADGTVRAMTTDVSEIVLGQLARRGD